MAYQPLSNKVVSVSAEIQHWLSSAGVGPIPFPEQVLGSFHRTGTRLRIQWYQWQFINRRFKEAVNPGTRLINTRQYMN
jgi:hypothetical protein